MPAPTSILISRTDSIGDVMLTLPLATALRRSFPEAKIYFLGKSYTQPVIEASAAVDAFIDKDEFLGDKVEWRYGLPEAIIHVFPVKEIALKAKSLGIAQRIGTRNRIYHWGTCNHLVKLSRRHSPLHEAQLNFALLQPLGIEAVPSLAELGEMYSFTKVRKLRPELSALLTPGKFHLILHPKSQGSAREWGIGNFQELINILDPSRYQIFISGTEAERLSLQPLVDACKGRVVDVIGKMDLNSFISFIAGCDGLVSASTGPLHIAAALGKRAIGIYPPIRPMHPGRWAPLGPKVIALALDKNCNDCRKDEGACHCIREVRAQQVLSQLDEGVQ